MKRMMLAAAALLASGPAMATVVYEKVGLGSFFVTDVDLAPGTYAFHVRYDGIVNGSFDIGVRLSYDDVCSADTDHVNPYVCGGETNDTDYIKNFSGEALTTITLAPVRFVPARGQDTYAGSQYLRDKFLFVVTQTGRSDNTPYHFSIDAVPEPAAWIMMIAGFAMAGLAARWRNLPGLA